MSQMGKKKNIKQEIKLKKSVRKTDEEEQRGRQKKGSFMVTHLG